MRLERSFFIVGIIVIGSASIARAEGAVRAVDCAETLQELGADRIVLTGSWTHDTVANAERGGTRRAPLILRLLPDGHPNAEIAPSHFVLVLDHSGSMSEREGGTTPLEQVLRALGANASVLERYRHWLSAVAFGDRAVTVATREPLTSGSIGEILQRLAAARTGESTEMGIALRAAHDLATGRTPQGGRRSPHVILLTDGHPNQPGPALTQADQLRAAGVPLTIIGVGTGWNWQYIDQLARRGAGTVRFLDPAHPEDTTGLFESLFHRLGRTAFTDVRMTLLPEPGVRFGAPGEFHPEVRPVTVGTSSQSPFVLSWDRLPFTAINLALDAHLPHQGWPGTYPVARVRVEYRSPDGRQHTREFQLVVTVGARPGAESPMARVAHRRVEAQQVARQLLESLWRNDMTSARAALDRLATIAPDIGSAGPEIVSLVAQARGNLGSGLESMPSFRRLIELTANPGTLSGGR